MKSLILRGYGHFNCMALRGYGGKQLAKIRAEIIRLTTAIVRTISRASQKTDEI